MPAPKISVIIPAASEELYLSKTIECIRAQDYRNFEVIVAVNGATDNTAKISQQLADATLVYKDLKGWCFPRNRGAEIAKGDIFLFLDADTLISANTLSEIAKHTSINTFGSIRGRGDSKKFSFRLYYWLKNLANNTHLRHGAVDGLVFCHKDLFDKTGGFNEAIVMGEIADFSSRAKRARGKYIYLSKCFATTSTRRLKKNGFFKLAAFWLKVGIKYVLGTNGQMKMKDYPGFDK